MSLYNVVDSRKHEFNNRCDVVYEIWDPDTGDDKSSFTEWTKDTTVYSATMKAMEITLHVTMYLYSPGMIENDFPILSYIHPRIKREPFCPMKLKMHLKPF